MNKMFLIMMGSIVGLIVILVVGLTLSYISYANYGNRAEKHLETLWNNEQNILSAYTLKVAEMAQVPQNMRDDLKDLMTATLSGRYGKDGSKATFQWIKEHNLPLEPSLYTKIQQTIESGRDEFKVAQSSLLDAKRIYMTNLDNVVSGFFLRNLAGYPKVSLDKYIVILDTNTKETFETGVAVPLKLR